MRAPIVHVSPTYFGADSVIGGGERYAESLSRALSRRTPVKLVSFGKAGQRERVSPTFERVILKSMTRSLMTPFSPALWTELAGARVIHCHQYFTLPTFLCALFGRMRGARVFVSDLGGGGWTPAYHLDQSRWIEAELPISEYAAKRLHHDGRHRVIYGGVDLDDWPARAPLRHDGSVVFLGRILPHKGIHFLVQAVDATTRLDIVGPASDAAYLDELHKLARGKNVRFLHGLGDAEVSQRLRSAMVLVHPTPVDDHGDAGISELFGLAVVEAMASACPVIVSDAASLPELVSHEETGLLVPPNDPQEIRAAIARLARDGELWAALAANARRDVERRFTWERVADRCLAAYGLDAAT